MSRPRLLVSAVALWAAMMNAACAAETVNVSGRVIDAITRLPIAGVRVDIGNPNGSWYKFVTSADGRFNVIGLAPGIVTISLEKIGMNSGTFSCDVPAGRNVRADFRIHGPYTNIGRVLDPDACALEPATSDLYIIR